MGSSARRSGLMLFVAAGFFLLAACGAKGQLSMAAYEKPDDVSNLRAVHRENAITLSWSYPGGEKYFITGFIVERADSGQQYRRLAVLAADTTNYADTSFVPGAVSQYRVFAVSRKDRLSEATVPVRVEPKPLPPPPTGLKARTTDEGVEIRWQTTGPGVRYNVYKSTVRGTCGEVPASASPLDVPVFRDSVNQTSTVYYCVRSLYATDLLDEGFPSAEYAVAPGMYVPGRVADLRGIATKQGVQLIWSERSEHWVKAYRVYRKLQNEKEFRMIGETVIPAFLEDSPDKAGALYAVEAVGPLHIGLRSSPLLISPYQEP